MENLPRKGRFLESLDSVRYNPSKKQPERFIQAEIELMVSLLFGESVVLPEAYSFDSLSFLELAPKILYSRDKIYPVKRNSPVWNPFILALRPNHHSYRQMVADLLRKPTFILSALPEITKDEKIREQLAQFVERGEYNEIEKIIGINISTWVERIDRYFSRVGFSRAIDNKYLLKDSLEWLLDANVSSELSPLMFELRQAMKKLNQHNIDLTHRGDFRAKGEELLEPNVFNALLEYVDGCYNRVLKCLVMAESGFFSTGVSGKDKYIQQAETLSSQAVSESISSYTLFGISKPDVGVKNMVWLEKIQKQISESWETIWEIVTDDDWIVSLEEYHITTDNYGQLSNQADEALHKHTEFIANRLTPFVAKREKKGLINLILTIPEKTGGVITEIGKELLILKMGWNIEPVMRSFTEPGSLTIGTGIGKLMTRGMEKLYQYYVNGSIGKCLYKSYRQGNDE